MSFLPTQFYGGMVINPGVPDIEEHLDVFFVPNTAETGRAWGIYDHGRHLVPATAFTRGPERELVMQEPVSNLDLHAVTETAPEDSYLYGGAMHVHFGHFLLSTLSRLWPLVRHDRGNLKILMNAGEEADIWFGIPHIAFAFEQLGLVPNDFVRFDRPTRIRRLLVPRASVEEQHAAWMGYADLTHRVGRCVTQGNESRNATPLYLSKSMLRSGVWRFENEDEVMNVLSRHGVDIIFPEQLTPADQIRLFHERDIVCGAVGSGLHSHVFTPRPPRIIAYNRDPLILSNFGLLDRVNQASAEYVQHSSGFTTVDPTPGFDLNCMLNDPIRVAEDLLDLLDPAKEGVARSVSRAPTTVTRTLDMIGLRHRTEKASSHHGFLPVYERLFTDAAKIPGLKILEIGIQNGASIRTWEEYFPDAAIIGIDTATEALTSASAQTTVEIADQSNIADLTRVAMTHGPFDIIIDDGSHFWGDQITSLRTLYPFLQPGGYYAIENIDTSYGHYEADYARLSDISAAEYLKRLLDHIAGDGAVDIRQEPDAFVRSYASLTESVSFFRRLAVIRRRQA